MPEPALPERKRDPTIGAVLDASAVLAFAHRESGRERVKEALVDGVAISAANLAEVLSKLAERGALPAAALHDLRTGLIDHGSLTVEPLTETDTVEIARLRLKTRHLGLSLADRACLALAARLGVPAMTADREWADADLGVEIQLIR